MQNKPKIALVVVGAVVLTTLGINASDLARGIQGTLTGSVGGADLPCGTEAVLVQFGDRALCVDRYEASAADSCAISDPQSALHTQENLLEPSCKPESTEGKNPWRFVNQVTAQQLCARAGKRLPNNEEWFRLSSGLADQSSCVVDSGSPEATGQSGCVTPSGVHDLVGNVWEWIDAEVVDGQYGDRQLPESGYVSSVDKDGIITSTASDPDVLYGEDYANTNSDGVRGMLRGGFYGSRDDAGLFSLNAAVPLTLETAGVGFRCVKNI